MSDEKKVIDKITKVQFEKDLENAKKELERSIKSLKEHEEMLVEMKKLAEVWKKAIPIIANNCRKINPEYEFETMDDYWELRKQVIRYEQMGNYYQLVDKQIPHMEKTIEAKKEAINSLKEKIAKMESNKS